MVIPESMEDKAGKLDCEEMASGPLGRRESTRARRSNANVISLEWISH
jgi:hypothetical protein